MFKDKVDMVFADPPYFLSNGGISVQSGKIVSVNKGDWDKGMSAEDIDAFNRKWIGQCRELLKDNGTIWISGTYHNIFSVATDFHDLRVDQTSLQAVGSNTRSVSRTCFHHTCEQDS